MSSEKRSRSDGKDTGILPPPKRFQHFYPMTVLLAFTKLFIGHHNAYEHIGAIVHDLAELGYDDSVLYPLLLLQWLNEVD